ncbi:MAG: helix-turn-helix transcriptional regulator, partial [Longimicrobiales bacterium]
MDWLNMLAGETRTRLLRLVRSAALSIRELSDALGITDNAVRTHVAALERDGLVRSAGVARSTGGKPARLYELTPEAEELFPKAYAQVMVELLAVLREDAGEAGVAELLRRTGRRLAADGAEPGDG